MPLSFRKSEYHEFKDYDKQQCRLACLQDGAFPDPQAVIPPTLAACFNPDITKNLDY